MRSLLLTIPVLLALAGCTGGAGSENVADSKLPPDAGKPLNPPGTALSPQMQRMAEVQNRGAQQAAQNINQQMMQAKEAQERAQHK